MILELLAQKTGLSKHGLQAFINGASHKYKVYYIPKIKGGYRKIAHPSMELKVLQKIIVENVLSDFPIHDSVFSYRKGRGIAANAARHVKNNFLLRVDFKDFFHSISWFDISRFLVQSNRGVDAADAVWISKALCRNKALTIGAPSSPLVSNIVLYELDGEIDCRAKANGITYTRYADDLFFSTNNSDVLEAFLGEIQSLLLEDRFPNLIINNAKTIFTSRKRRKVVTGLVLTSDRKISIGRKKKRFIKGMIFKFLNNLLAEEEKATLRGHLSYIKSVEPSFLDRIKLKFGNNIIQKICSDDSSSL